MHVVGWEFVAVALALFVGAILQGVIGFGMIVLAYPVLILIEPELIPQTTLVSAVPAVAVMAWRCRGHVAWHEIGWFSLGRVPGYVGAIVMLSVLSRSVLTVAGGISVLAAVGLSLWAPEVTRSNKTLVAGGAAAAMFGTAIGIGGPPIGLLYQNESGDRLRSTISLQMLFGAPVSILVLLLAGKMQMQDVRTGVAFLPVTVGGNYAARWVIPYFDDRLRPLILSICGLAAVLAIAKVLLF